MSGSKSGVGGVVEAKDAAAEARRKKSAPAAAGKTPSLLAQYDDLTRSARALVKGDEEEFLNILGRQEAARKLWLSLQEEHERCSASISSMERDNLSLETQLKHARNQIELELERRKRAERDRNALEAQIGSIRELLVDKKDNSIRIHDIDRDKLIPVLNYSSLGQSSPGGGGGGGGHSPVKRGGGGGSISASALGLHLGQGGPPPVRGSTTTTTTTLTPRRRILDTIDESSNSLVDDRDISYDKTLDDDLDGGGNDDDDVDDDDRGTPVVANFTVRRPSGGRKSGRRSGKRPSPPAESTASTTAPAGVVAGVPNIVVEEADENKGIVDEDELSTSAKRRRSDEKKKKKKNSFDRASGGGGGDDRVIVVDCTESTPRGRRSAAMAAAAAMMTKNAASSPNLARVGGGGGVGGGNSASTILRTPSTATLSPGKGLSQPHAFAEKTIVRMETCQPCGKRITFGKTAAKCRDCKSICHLECRYLVPVPCIGAASNSAQKSGAGTPTSATKSGSAEKGYLADFAPADRPQVPGIIVHCVKEVEARGLTEAGLYRVPGSEAVVKELLHRFFKGKGMPNLGRIDDINVVCSLLKHFLRQLREPVTTYPLWSSFVHASSLFAGGRLSESVSAVQDAVSRLPPANRDTLAFLLLHLIRVAETKATKMPVHNLAKVFGPTIVGYSSPEPEALQMLNEPKMQADVLELLMAGIGPAFWEGIVRADDASWMSFNTTTGGGELTNINPRASGAGSVTDSAATPTQRRSGRGRGGSGAGGRGPAPTPIYLKVQSASPVFQ